MISLTGEEIIWIPVSDHNPELRALADRHYSRKTIGAYRTAGPGRYFAMITPDGKAGFIWRYTIYRKDDQTGWECTMFRNEAPEKYRSSFLIRKAMEFLFARIGPTRVFTYINPSKIRNKHDPGHCFKKAGWQFDSTNVDGKLIVLSTEPSHQQDIT